MYKMKKLLFTAALAATLSYGSEVLADEVYPDWLWTGAGWVYIGVLDGEDPDPLPPPIKK